MTIKDIQNVLKNLKIDAYIVTHGNRFIGQDILPQEHKLKKICGFSGSDGVLIILHDKVFLLVDGRYELQAQMEVDQNVITIIKQIPHIKNVCNILLANKCHQIGYDAWSSSIYDIVTISRKYKQLKFTDVGDLIKTEKRHGIKIIHRSEKYAGQSKSDKCKIVADFLKENNADYFLFCAADSVSWLMNIYSNDLLYSPVVRAYVMVDKNEEIKLFGDGFTADFPVYNWIDFENTIKNLRNARILCDFQTAPQAIIQMVQDSVELIGTPDICRLLKVEKNSTEIRGMINCHIRDGVALTKFLYWLDYEAKNITELDVVRKLHEFRKIQDDFISESFATIAGFASNGAIVHYQPQYNTNKDILEGNLLLIDSGAQYLDGTTDVTRTVAIGVPQNEMIDDFTHVLKAHIALANAVFPIGTSGKNLDIIARMKIWETKEDYKHGTGHGVGCFGNVHEGPINISSYGSEYGFKQNMVVSNEPGIYREGKYGIRIENLQYTVSDNNIYLRFMPLTKVPIDKKLIDVYLLNEEEKAWLNAYHQDVYDTLKKFMNEKELNWLKKACSPL